MERNYKRRGDLIRSMIGYLKKYPLFNIISADDPLRLRIGFLCVETGECWFYRIIVIRKNKNSKYKNMSSEEICKYVKEEACRCMNIDAQNVLKS